MQYEVEAFKNDSLHCESNAVVGIVRAIAEKLKVTYEELYDPKFKGVIHEALKPLYNQADRMAWRLEYLLRAIQESEVGKNLTPKGCYLDSAHHQFLTTDGRFHAPGVEFKSYFSAISLVNREGKTIGWANLSFEELAKLKDHISNHLKSSYEDLRANIESLKKEIAAGEAATQGDKEQLQAMEADLVKWEKLL